MSPTSWQQLNEDQQKFFSTWSTSYNDDEWEGSAPLVSSAPEARPPTSAWEDLDQDLLELVTDTFYPTLLNYQVPVAEPLLHYYTAGADESLYGQIGDTDGDGSEYMEMLFPD